MSATFLVDLDSAVVETAIRPVVVASATTTVGVAIDATNVEGPITFVISTGDAGDSTLVVTGKVTECDTSGGTYTDITGATIASMTGATASDNKTLVLITPYRSKRYLKLEITTAGAGTLSLPLSAVFLGRKKVGGSGGGHYTAS
jgi:hypothetical protein